MFLKDEGMYENVRENCLEYADNNGVCLERWRKAVNLWEKRRQDKNETGDFHKENSGNVIVIEIKCYVDNAIIHSPIK